MKTTTSPLLPAALSVAAAVLVGGLAFFLRERLGPWQFAFYCGGLLALGGGLLPHPRRLRGWAGRLCGRSAPGDSGREQDSPAEELPRELAALLDERLRAVEQRERELADRLAAYHEWFEFPPPIRLGESRPPTAEMWERDRRLADLLEERTRSAFEKVRQNAYSPGGEFDAKLVRDDVLELVTAIARLYGRDPENPIAGVSVERILRAASRCCLKFLNELETLPLDVRHYDLATVYGYVRQAVRVYGLYQSASPFMPWLARAYYGTRFAMGANPLALGVWWFAGAVGKRGATALAVKLANRWALAFLHDIVRVIGFEMASVYDAGFRYRDPNWCYAAELTELVRRFPGSESSLRGALGQIGSLQLRNEYDRIYFFRCLAEGKSPDFTRIQPSALPPEQRRQIAERLEAFLVSHIAQRETKTTERWRADVERRLDLRLAIAEPAPPRPQADQGRDAIRALAGYLLEIKQCESETLPSHLEETAVARSLPSGMLPEVWEDLRDNPPFFFEIPELQPGGSAAKDFVGDLVWLSVRVAPRYAAADEIAIAAAVHLRAGAKETKALLDRAYADHLASLLPADVPLRRLPSDAARAVLDLVEGEERLLFVYGGVRPVAPDQGDLAAIDRSKAWLVGVGRRLVALSVTGAAELFWQGDNHVRLACPKGRLKGGCRLTGGQWTQGTTRSTPVLLVKGALVRSNEKYFAPLERFCSGAR
ncbi:MAG: hypothetical protein PHO07_03065 [Pirellulales bacterium]|nr:hypothetical protein [Thermoguttaceae bacterium]MDD4786128.1 hypothetical protein [Pirellulales bacterium]MDI9445944.1 hypothetical protein [Planctomycetota bacterium]NLZ02049.1 hypothetical protein [Pirellulaceae bacterium]